MTTRARHFRIQELVPPETFNVLGDNAWIVLDERAVFTLDELRHRYGKAVVNNWLHGGGAKYRGYRPPNCNVGAKHSQHRFGRAFDVSFSEVTSEEVRQDIIKNPSYFPHIRRIELGTPHFHFDLAFTGRDDLFLFYP